MDNIIQNGDELDNIIQNGADLDNIIRQNQFLDNDWGGWDIDCVPLHRKQKLPSSYYQQLNSFKNYGN